MNLLSSLRYLVALNEHKHFGRAAQACHITQPALSNALRALETEFNVSIVKRDRTYVGLTPEGERVLASAQMMLREHAVLQQDLKSETHLPNGPLRLGAVPTAMPILTRFAAMLQSRHRGIVPVVLSMSSADLDKGLADLSLDLALGYTERLVRRDSRLAIYPQYTEHYFLLRRSPIPNAPGLVIGPTANWADIAKLPLCLLTPDMHNRTIVDAALTTAGLAVHPAMETNSILTLALAVVAGTVSSVLPGALVDAVRGYGGLEALTLVKPEVRTPIGFISHSGSKPSRALEAALVLVQDSAWLHEVAAHSGLLAA